MGRAALASSRVAMRLKPRRINFPPKILEGKSCGDGCQLGDKSSLVTLGSEYGECEISNGFLFVAVGSSNGLPFMEKRSPRSSGTPYAVSHSRALFQNW